MPNKLDKIIISIAIPVYNMPNKDFFLERCLNSIREQTYQNYEIVMTEEGKMAENTNAAIKKSIGKFIKILYMDDYFAHKNALRRIVESFTGDWMITGCDNNPKPYWTDDIHTGNNKLGSPSCLTIKNKDPLLFDENLGWLLDADYYKRMYKKYGPPTILNDINIIIGVGEHQATNLMGDKIKIKEQEYLQKKYG